MMHDYVLPSEKWVWLTHYVWLADASQMQVELEFNFDFNYLNTGCVLQALHISWLVSWALVLLQLYLQMPHPGNVTQEEFNSAKEESHQAPASVSFACMAFLFGFVFLGFFFFLKYIRTILFYICKSNDLENSASRQRPSLPTWACRSPGRGALWRGACAAVPGCLWQI